MKLIRQKINGRLYQHPRGWALLLDPEASSLAAAPPAAAPPVAAPPVAVPPVAVLLTLRYGLVTRGPEIPFLPALLLDDWGREIRGVGLYDWIQEHGPAFPRAELFGVDLTGAETQYFLRDLELDARYPCWAYLGVKEKVENGRLLSRILLPSPAASAPVKIKPPADIPAPLQQAKVSWWQLNPAQLAENGYLVAADL